MCPFCRLAKCFANGMQIELIRGCTSRKNKIKSKKKIPQKPLTTMSTNSRNFLQVKIEYLLKFFAKIYFQLSSSNLLKTDQSILTIDQWKIFSNLILCYDEHTSLSLVERFIFQQNILPLKLRFKSTYVNELFSLIFAKTKLIFEKNFDFINLHSNDRSILLHHQMKYLIIISSSYIAQQSNLFDHPVFNETIEILSENIILSKNKFLCFDILFLKLSFGIISFSSFDYTIRPIEYLTNIERIIEIQNRYIELTWRYLIYVYDEKQAINCFLNLIQYIFVVMDKVILLKDKKGFVDRINNVIEQTKQSFT